MIKPSFNRHTSLELACYSAAMTDEQKTAENQTRALAPAMPTSNHTVAQRIVDTLRVTSFKFTFLDGKDITFQLAGDFDKQLETMATFIERSLDQSSDIIPTTEIEEYTYAKLCQWVNAQTNIAYSNPYDNHPKATLKAAIMDSLAGPPNRFIEFVDATLHIADASLGELNIEKEIENADDQLKSLLEHHSPLSDTVSSHIRLNRITDVIDAHGSAIYEMLYQGKNHESAYKAMRPVIEDVKNRLLNTTEQDGVWHSFSDVARTQILRSAIARTMRVDSTISSISERYKPDTTDPQLQQYYLEISETFPSTKVQMAMAEGRIPGFINHGQLAYGDYFN